jgi:hypothetical protein
MLEEIINEAKRRAAERGPFVRPDNEEILVTEIERLRMSSSKWYAKQLAVTNARAVRVECELREANAKITELQNIVREYEDTFYMVRE